MSSLPAHPVWTLITVTYNSASTLRSLFAPCPADVEWIVVDNGSTDDSAAVARSLGAAQVIELTDNRGFGAANNVGFAAANGRYVAFINPDVTVDYADLPALAARIDDGGGLVSPQLINPDGSLQPNGRGMPLLTNKVLNRLRTPDKGEDTYLIYSPEAAEKYVFWLMGASIAGTVEELRPLGPWDERFFLYYEDSDIGIRAWKAGLTVRLHGDAQWVHGWARETKTFRLRPWLREIASMARFYSRYPELLVGGAWAVRRHPAAASQLGRDALATGRPEADTRTVA